MDRVCIFIDGSNLYYGLKRNGNPTRMDYHQFSKALVAQGEDRKLTRTYYYNAAFDPAAFPDKAAAQRPFFDSMDRTPFLELRLGRIIQNREGVRTEKGVDVRMASDMVYYAARNAFDTAIIVTEDQDFVPAIALAKEMGKQIEIAVYPDALAREMSRVADRILYLDKILGKGGDNAAIFPKEGPEPGNV